MQHLEAVKTLLLLALWHVVLHARPPLAVEFRARGMGAIYRRSGASSCTRARESEREVGRHTASMETARLLTAVPVGAAGT